MLAKARSRVTARENKALSDKDSRDRSAAFKILVKLFPSDDKQFFRRNKKAAGEKRRRLGNSSASSPARTIPWSHPKKRPRRSSRTPRSFH